MKKILYLVSTLRRSGPNQQLYNMLRFTERRLFDPYVLTLSPEPVDSCQQIFVELGARIESLALNRVEGVLLAGAKLREKIYQFNPDLIHSQGFRADLLLARARLPIPWLLTCRNDPYVDYSGKYGLILGRLMAFRHLSAMKRCSHVVACSKTIANCLHGRGIRSTAIPNGVQLLSPSGQIFLRNRELKPPVFLSMGSLIPRKNMELLVKAFVQFSNFNSGTLLILGDGRNMEKLKSIASTSTSVIFAGQVDNVVEYLSKADYFVSSSFSEGLPNSVLEALSAGLPAILSDIPSHREIAQECPDACKLFKLNNGMDELVSIFSKASTIFSGVSRVGISRSVEKTFSAQSMSENYQQEYLRIISLR